MHGDGSDHGGGAAVGEKYGRGKKRMSGGSGYFVETNGEIRERIDLDFFIFCILILLIILGQNLCRIYVIKDNSYT